MINRNWSGALTKSQKRINMIADSFYAMFKQKAFSIFNVSYIDKPFPFIECELECEISKGDWVDDTKHPVKIIENGFMFLSGNSAYIYLANDIKENTCLSDGENPHFNFQNDRLIVTHCAPDKHVHTNMFVITGDMKKNTEDYPHYMPSKSYAMANKHE